MKRLFDLIFSSIFILVFSPVLLVISAIIKLSSEGPAIFKQRRIGQNKKEFFIFKFRTMYVGTPNNVATHRLESPDKYITSVGKVLRKTSLDELPQLFNILKGEMSFVGPRPALYNQYDLIELRDSYGINDIKPGVTGWAQVNGRDELEIPVKVEFDRYYKENSSILLDIRIILLTMVSVFMAKGVVEGNQTINKNC